MIIIRSTQDLCHGHPYSLKGLPAAFVLFRWAIRATESWFLSDPDAVKEADPRVNPAVLKQFKPAAIMPAAKILAQALGRKTSPTGMDKIEWAQQIAPHLNLDQPTSPSLAKLLAGLQRQLHLAAS